MSLAGGAAAFAAPALAPFPDRDCGDDERRRRIEPPEAEQCVTEQADENGGGEVGAEQVLGPLAPGCDRAKLVGEPALAMPRNGIPITLVLTSAIPSQLVSGCSPVTSLWTDSNAT